MIEYELFSCFENVNLSIHFDYLRNDWLKYFWFILRTMFVCLNSAQMFAGLQSIAHGVDIFINQLETHAAFLTHIFTETSIPWHIYPKYAYLSLCLATKLQFSYKQSSKIVWSWMKCFRLWIKSITFIDWSQRNCRFQLKW